VPGRGARPMLQAAKRAGAAAIDSGGGQEDRCRTATPMIQTLVVRVIRSIGGCLTAMPNQAGYAGSSNASSTSRPLGVAGCDGGSRGFCGANPADAPGRCDGLLMVDAPCPY
jgi:hypothetical protein